MFNKLLLASLLFILPTKAALESADHFLAKEQLKISLITACRELSLKDVVFYLDECKKEKIILNINELQEFVRLTATEKSFTETVISKSRSSCLFINDMMHVGIGATLGSLAFFKKLSWIARSDNREHQVIVGLALAIISRNLSQAAINHIHNTLSSTTLLIQVLDQYPRNLRI